LDDSGDRNARRPHLLAEVSFSRLGRRKMAGGVLDDGGARRLVAYKSGLFAFRARMSGARSAALFDLLRAK